MIRERHLAFLSKARFACIQPARWSHVGRRPILLEEGVVCSIQPIHGGGGAFPASRNTYKTTPFHQSVELRGPLGVLSFRLPLGLYALVKDHPGFEQQRALYICKIADSAGRPEGLGEAERKELDQWNAFTKAQKKFVSAMWGTSASTLSNHVIGLTQVT